MVSTIMRKTYGLFRLIWMIRMIVWLITKVSPLLITGLWLLQAYLDIPFIDSLWQGLGHLVSKLLALLSPLLSALMEAL